MLARVEEKRECSSTSCSSSVGTSMDSIGGVYYILSTVGKRVDIILRDVWYVNISTSRDMFLPPEKSTGGAWDVLCVCINDQC